MCVRPCPAPAGVADHGGATAGEILELIERIRHKAREERGVELETEVQIVGD